MVSKWSRPFRIKEKLTNLYKLETLDRQRIEGEFHTRRLREFRPREGTRLAREQKELEEALEREAGRELEARSNEDTAFLKTGAHGAGGLADRD